MWGFFIALIGGIYWLGKYLNDRADAKEFQQRVGKESEIQKSITATDEQECNIENLLLDENTRYQMLEGISEELREIYGENWEENFVDTSEFYSPYIGNPWCAALNIILSKHGLVQLHFRSLYKLSGRQEITNRIIQTCEIIERNIQKVHPGMRMLFVPGEHTGYNGKIDYFYEELSLGDLYWEYAIPRRSNAWNPPIRRLW